MQYWVTAPYVKVDIDVLDVMKEFAMSIKSSEVMKRLAKELCCAIAERVWFWRFHSCLIFVSLLPIIAAIDFSIKIGSHDFAKSY